MYINSSNKLILHSNDINNVPGIISQLTSVSTITILYENNTQTINIENFNIENVNLVSVTLSKIPDNFFSDGKTYVLYPCLNTTSSNNLSSNDISPSSTQSGNYLQQIIIDNQLYNGFLVFLLFIIFIVIYLNWGYLYNLYSTTFSSQLKNTDKHSGGKIYYIGGYNYRDYLD
jgi:hypothetical protein